MPYTVKGKCVYKKEDGSKVGCTKGSVEKYLGALHANANESITEDNKLVGGYADNLTPSDIAKKHGVSLEKIQQQIEKGIKVEREHTNNKGKEREIAMDHLSEFPDYYDNLEKMEDKEKKKWNTNESTKDKIQKILHERLIQLK